MLVDPRRVSLVFSADRVVVVVLTLSCLLLCAELVWWATGALLPR